MSVSLNKTTMNDKIGNVFCNLVLYVLQDILTIDLPWQAHPDHLGFIVMLRRPFSGFSEVISDVKLAGWAEE